MAGVTVGETLWASPEVATQKKPIGEWDEEILVLGIETSCDETSAAVVKGGREILSNIIVSQGELHGEYGGIVPELAARQHVEALTPAIREALFRADVTFWDLDGVRPGGGPADQGRALPGPRLPGAPGLAWRSPRVKPRRDRVPSIDARRAR